MGCRKIYALIKEELDLQGIKIGRDKLFNLMSDNQMLIRKRKGGLGQQIHLIRLGSTKI
jgi:phage antirepressor YoqD-like protein